jgi:hypothetical protein
MYQGVIPQCRIVHKFGVKKNHDLAGAHTKFSAALQFIVTHVESSYAHSPFSGIFV